MEYPHQPVLVPEVIKALLSTSDGLYVDGTVGTGGHSLAIVGGLSEKGRLVCLDRDPDAVRISKKRLAPFGERVIVVKANFAQLEMVLQDLRVEKADGVFLDLGMSSYQLERSGRGFSFGRDERLDMRMDPSDEVTAHQLVNTLSQRELERILKTFGEEKNSRSIARAITMVRRKTPIESSNQLADLIESALPFTPRFKERHPATKTFQALRIAVNRELENLQAFLSKIPSLITKGGRLVVLSYHSLEDRMVKNAMSRWEKGCSCPPDLPRCVCGEAPVFKRLFRKVRRPGAQEREKNPRSRSAMMRGAERV